MNLNIAGERFGRLLAIERVGIDKSRNALWRCICDCGGERVAVASSLARGGTKSCGCLAKDTKPGFRHGLTRTPAWLVWRGVRNRCLTPTHTAYHLYGGRGITICERWRESFENFFADMGHPPPGAQLDRYPDNDGNYEPTNCRWATKVQQARNRSTNVIYTHEGRSLCVADFADEYGIAYDTLLARLARGMSITEALNTPVIRSHWRGAKRAGSGGRMLIDGRERQPGAMP